MHLRAGPSLVLLTVALAACGLVWWTVSPNTGAAARPSALTTTALHAVDSIPATLDVGSEERRPTGQSVDPENPTIAELGTLRVQVRSRDTGEPLGGERLFLVLADGPWQQETFVDGAVVGPGESPVTDQEGFAQFQVPLDVDHTLKSDRTFFLEDYDLKVPAFVRPETREVVLELPTVNDLPFCGRILASGTDEPLPRARVRLEEGFEVTSGDDGYFEVLVPSWRWLNAKVEVPGYGLARIEIGPGHESRADALVVRLHESARLDVLVLDKDGAPLEGAEIRLSTEHENVGQGWASDHRFGGRDEWTSRTDAVGRCSLRGLPPFAPLTVEARKDPIFRRAEVIPVSLGPREVRELTLRVKSGATITGHLIDEAGESTEGVEIWLVAAQATGSPYLEERDNPVSKTETTEGGSFEFINVPDGTWWVGAAPGGLYPPRAEVVEVIDGIGEGRVLLELTRGLFIAGQVVDPRGESVEGAWLQFSARCDDLHDAWTDGEGRFEVGPLPRGAYWMSVQRTLRHPPPPPTWIEAGTKDVWIQLLLGGAIRGKLVDGATGAPATGQVLLTTRTKSREWTLATTGAGGEFEFPGLEGGSYDLYASTASGGFALENVDVAVSARPLEVQLEVLPGATLDVRYVGSQPYAYIDVLFGNSTLASAGIEWDTPKVHVVPPGRVRVECSWAGLAAPEVQEVTLAAGEERELVLGQGP
jgi:hypothetical protein